MSEELKACPFCGKPGERWIDESGDRPSKAHGCRYCYIVNYDDDGTEWNTRPIEEELRAALAACQEKLDASHKLRFEVENDYATRLAACQRELIAMEHRAIAAECAHESANHLLVLAEEEREALREALSFALNMDHHDAHQIAELEFIVKAVLEPPDARAAEGEGE